MSKELILILGGARSGKSRFAQELAAGIGDKVLFVATGEPLDEEMQARIDEHRKNRPENWRTLEARAGIGRQINKQAGDADVVIVDCLTLLLSNLLSDEPNYIEAENRVTAEINELIASISGLGATFIIVSNEVGMGLVPDNRLGRIYRDMLGKANQLIAQCATEVYVMVAGIPTKVKRKK